MPARILLLASNAAHTGNRTTALRVASHLRSPGEGSDSTGRCIADDDGEEAEAGGEVAVHIVDALDNAAASAAAALAGFGSSGSADLSTSKCYYDAVFGIHLYRAGKYLVQSDEEHIQSGSEASATPGQRQRHTSGRENRPPVVMVLGGTDVNVDVHITEKKRIMDAVLDRAVAIVALHEDQRTQFCSTPGWEKHAAKVHLIRPSVVTHEPRGSLVDTATLRSTLGLPPLAVPLLLLPCGLRPVKNPLFVVDAFHRWRLARVHSDPNAPVLVIVGAAYNAEFADFENSVRQQISELHVPAQLGCVSSSVILLPPMEQASLHALMRASCAVVSSSDAEGLPNTLLEAQQLGVPVLARSCIGNVSVVKDGLTGLLFGDPDKFIEKLNLLISNENSELVHRDLVANGRKFVEREFGIASERTAFRKLLQLALKNGN